MLSSPRSTQTTPEINSMLGTLFIRYKYITQRTPDKSNYCSSFIPVCPYHFHCSSSFYHLHLWRRGTRYKKTAICEMLSRCRPSQGLPWILVTTLVSCSEPPPHYICFARAVACLPHIIQGYCFFFFGSNNKAYLQFLLSILYGGPLKTCLGVHIYSFYCGQHIFQS